MKKMYLISTIALVFSIIFTREPVYAQNPDNYYTICDKWDMYYNDHPDMKVVEDGGYTQFLRWKEFWRTRVNNGNPNENGSFKLYSDAIMSYFTNKDYFTRPTNIYSDWHFLGPKNIQTQNIGLVSAVYVDTISDKSMKTIYIGTNSSGIWRTIDEGKNWLNLTDGSLFYVNGITDIVGDPNNSNVIYATTGGGFMGDHAYSSGIIKTINNGQTWDQFYPLDNSTKQSVNGILIDPANTNHIYALVDNAVLRTLDGGIHWWPILKISSLSGPDTNERRYCRNIVMKPGDAGVIYVATDDYHWINHHRPQVWKIMNALSGDTNLISREQLDLELPNNGQIIYTERFNVAVTASNPNAIYIACNAFPNNNTDTISKLKVWKYDSIWSLEIDRPFSSDGIGFFKFEFLVSPTDQNVIYIGGLGMEKFVKKDGSWILKVHTTGGQHDMTYHFDTRDAKILQGSLPGTAGTSDVLFAGNDGGISLSRNGIHDWRNLNGNGLGITQFYGIGSANSASQTVFCGSQDNCFFKFENGIWSNHEAGDWGNILVDNEFPQIMYGNNWGSGHTFINKSITAGVSWGAKCKDTIRHERRLDNTPMALNPNNSKTIFFAAENLYRSYDRLDSTYSKISIPQAECETCNRNAIAAFCIAPSDTMRIYVVISGIPWQQPKKFFRSQDYGLSWENLTNNVVINQVPIFDNYFVSDIIVSPTDRETIWMTLTGFWSPWGDKSRVIVSHDGGASFSNYSEGLPNMPVNCIRYMNGTNDRLLVGTDVGAFYIDNSLTEWQPFNTGLPICPINDLEINDNTRQVRAGTFGRGLWETGLDCTFNVNNPLTIHQNTTWINDTAIDNSIFIDSSYTLTIRGRVMLPPMAKIYVKQGGKLLVDGGVLTNKCINYWQGIEVWGRYDKPQSTLYQGVINLKNDAILENSRIGITTCKKDQNGYTEWSTTGGIIIAENSVFRNNYKAVEFFMNLKGQYSTFKKVTFETTPDFINGAIPSDFVSLAGVRGVRFLGCIFRNTSSPTDTIPSSIAGRGIFSINSSFQVDHYEYCPQQVYPCPNPQITPSLFKGLRYGVRALASDPTYSIFVNNTRFDHNYRGVYFGNINNVVVTKDTFNLITYSTSRDTIYGLYLGKSSGYKVQENRFHCRGNVLITNPDLKISPREFGIVIDSSGSAPNEIYKNYFDSLDVAINAQKHNKSYNDSTGLVLKCNMYHNNSYDEIITSKYANNHEGIAVKQGAKTLDDKDPAGNEFSPYHSQYSNSGSMDKLDIKNQADAIKYFHHIQPVGPQPPRIEPTMISNNVTKQNTGREYTPFCCPSKLDSGGGGSNLDEKKEKMSLEQFKVDSLTTILTQLVDGGNTDALNINIMLSTAQQALDLKQDLLQKSPYLSDTVMKSAIDKETVLPNEMIRDVMVANPQFAQADNVLDVLNSRFVPMPEQMLNEILAGTDSLSPKENLDARLHSAKLDRQYAFNELLRYFQNDTINPSSGDSLLALLAIEPTLDAQYMLAFEYFSMDMNDQMNNILEQIQQRFTLTNIQQQQYEDYLDYFIFLVSQKNENRNIYQLNEEDIAKLQDFQTNAMEPIKTYAQNILEANSMLTYFEPILLPDDTKSVPERKTIKFRGSANNCYIRIFPNPSCQYVIIDYNANDFLSQGEQLFLTISTTEGKLIVTKLLNKREDQVMVETTYYKPGLYICKMIADKRIKGSATFTVIH